MPRTISVKQALELLQMALDFEKEQRGKEYQDLRSQIAQLQAENIALGKIISTIATGGIPIQEIPEALKTLPESLKIYIHFFEDRQEDKETLFQLYNELREFKAGLDTMYTAAMVKMPSHSIREEGNLRDWIRGLNQASQQVRDLWERAKS